MRYWKAQRLGQGGGNSGGPEGDSSMQCVCSSVHHGWCCMRVGREAGPRLCCCRLAGGEEVVASAARDGGEGHGVGQVGEECALEAKQCPAAHLVAA